MPDDVAKEAQRREPSVLLQGCVAPSHVEPGEEEANQAAGLFWQVAVLEQPNRRGQDHLGDVAEAKSSAVPDGFNLELTFGRSTSI